MESEITRLNTFSPLSQNEQIVAAHTRVQQISNGACLNGSSLSSQRRVKLVDVEAMVSAFTGDDDYGVLKWLSDFESVIGSLKGDDDDSYRLARGMLKGTAVIFLRTIRVDGWNGLRTALIGRFHRQVSYYEVFEKLRPHSSAAGGIDALYHMHARNRPARRRPRTGIGLTYCCWPTRQDCVRVHTGRSDHRAAVNRIHPEL